MGAERIEQHNNGNLGEVKSPSVTRENRRRRLFGRASPQVGASSFRDQRVTFDTDNLASRTASSHGQDSPQSASDVHDDIIPRWVQGAQHFSGLTVGKRYIEVNILAGRQSPGNEDSFCFDTSPSIFCAGGEPAPKAEYSS